MIGNLTGVIDYSTTEDSRTQVELCSRGVLGAIKPVEVCAVVSESISCTKVHDRNSVVQQHSVAAVNHCRIILIVAGSTETWGVKGLDDRPRAEYERLEPGSGGALHSAEYGQAADLTDETDD